jgi:hypothetical protein
MSGSQITTCPLSPADRAILGKLRDKALFNWARLYIPISLMLVWVYFEMQPGNAFRGHTLKYSKSEFSTVYPFFAAFFGLVFLGFMVRDFRRMILPFIKEARRSEKNCYSFSARKYLDPIYDKRLLFYPGKEDLYIEVSKEDFDIIWNGEQLQFEVGCITGEVLSLRSPDRAFKDPAEFSFSDM